MEQYRTQWFMLGFTVALAIFALLSLYLILTTPGPLRPLAAQNHLINSSVNGKAVCAGTFQSTTVSITVSEPTILEPFSSILNVNGRTIPNSLAYYGQRPHPNAKTFAQVYPWRVPPDAQPGKYTWVLAIINYHVDTIPSFTTVPFTVTVCPEGVG